MTAYYVGSHFVTYCKKFGEIMVLQGYLEHFLFRNEDNGYTVFNFAMEKEDVICVGFFKSIEQGETLELTGDFINHNVYGEQFKVEEYKIIPPTDRIAMERYLGSGAIKGVGEALAKRIVKAFGNDTFRIIEEEPERLAEIKGISERKARDIAVQMLEKKDLREAMLFLQKYGISNTLAIKIYKEYDCYLGCKRCKTAFMTFLPQAMIV